MTFLGIAITCVVCGGKVSSDARSCPHCGTPNYKSADYLHKESVKREQDYRAAQEEQVRKKAIRDAELGEHVRIVTRQRGSFGSMTRQRIEFYIDDRKLWEYHDPDVSDESSDYVYSYRLRKGPHTVKLISNETKIHITTLPLNYNGEREIEIIYKGSNNGLFWDSTKYWLVDVRCK